MAGRSLEIDKSILDEIVARICASASPERIILFGSAATGEMNKDSNLLKKHQSCFDESAD